MKFRFPTPFTRGCVQGTAVASLLTSPLLLAFDVTTLGLLYVVIGVFAAWMVWLDWRDAA